MNKYELIKSRIIEMADYAKMTKQELIIDTFIVARYLDTSQRVVRKVLSELRNDMIIFLPLKNEKNRGIYFLFNEEDWMHNRLLEEYVKTITKSLRTQYFNDVVKLKKIIRDEKIKNDIGQLQAELGDEQWKTMN